MDSPKTFISLVLGNSASLSKYSGFGEFSVQRTSLYQRIPTVELLLTKPNSRTKSKREHFKIRYLKTQFWGNFEAVKKSQDMFLRGTHDHRGRALSYRKLKQFPCWTVIRRGARIWMWPAGRQGWQAGRRETPV